MSSLHESSSASNGGAVSISSISSSSSTTTADDDDIRETPLKLQSCAAESRRASGNCNGAAHGFQKCEQRYVAAPMSQRLQNGKAHSSPGLRSNEVAAPDHTRWTLHPNDDESATRQNQQINHGISNGHSHPNYLRGEITANHWPRPSALHKRSHSGASSTSSDENRRRHSRHQEPASRDQALATLNDVSSSVHHTRLETSPATLQTSVKTEESGSNGDARGHQPAQHDDFTGQVPSSPNGVKEERGYVACRVTWCTREGLRYGLCWSHGGVKKCCINGCPRSANRGEFCEFHEQSGGFNSG